MSVLIDWTCLAACVSQGFSIQQACCDKLEQVVRIWFVLVFVLVFNAEAFWNIDK